MIILGVTFLGIITKLLIAVNVLVCFLLIFVVLMQRPKNEGLGAAFGGDTASNIFGAQTTNVLVNLTRWLAAIFMVVTIILSLLYSRNEESRTATTAYIADARKKKDEDEARKKAEEAAKSAMDASKLATPTTSSDGKAPTLELDPNAPKPPLITPPAPVIPTPEGPAKGTESPATPPTTTPPAAPVNPPAPAPESTPPPAKPEPAKPEPAKPEPAKPEPAKPEPVVDAPAPKPGLLEAMKAKMGEALKAPPSAPKAEMVDPVRPVAPPETSMPQPPQQAFVAPPPPPPAPVAAPVASAPPPATQAATPPQVTAAAPAPKPASRNPFDSLEEEMAKLLGRAPDGKG